MSFNDLNDLEGHPTEYSDEIQSPEFVNLTKSISAKVFKLSSNVTLVHRYIGLLGTPRDTEKMRTSLMDTLTRTQKLTKDLLPNIRELSRWDAEEVGPNGRYEQKKLTVEYQKTALDFQNAQRLALEKQKDYVKDVKSIIEEENRAEDRSHRSYEHQQEQQRLHLLDNSDIEFNEQLIEEREQEIQDIEMGINELNEIFKDIATIITEQGTVLGILPSRIFLS